MAEAEGAIAAPGLLANPIMRSFLHGQYANLFKMSFWWVALAPLLLAITGRTEAIGYGRIAYNVALCLISPFGALLIERATPRRILLSAAAVRFAMWCVALPLIWLFFATTLISSEVNDAAAEGCVLALLFIDGAAVACSVVLDIDMMGVDVVAGAFGFEVTDDDRNQFNGRQELFFSLCFVLFSPAMAFLGLAIQHGISETGGHHLSTDMVESGTLSALFVATFAVASVANLLCFRRLTPDGAAGAGEAAALNGDAATSAPLITTGGDVNGPEAMSESAASVAGGDAGAEAPTGFGAQVTATLGDLKDSAALIFSHRPILFRLIFLGLEIAFEDAAIVVLAAQLGLSAPWLGAGDAVKGGIWTSLAVAAGKFGGAIASVLMMRFYTPPEDMRGHRKLFFCIGVSTLVIIALPGIVYGHHHDKLSDNAARALFLLTFGVYFFLSTLPKLGLMSLLQAMVQQIENGHRAFAFIAIIATSIDALIVMLLSAMFARHSGTAYDTLYDGLWVCVYIYVSHGVLESIVGPLLVLRPAAAAEAVAAEAQQREAAEAEGQKAAEAQVTMDHKPSHLGVDGQGPAGATRSPRPSTLADGTLVPERVADGSQYTQRGVSVPVSVVIDGTTGASPRAPSGFGRSPRYGTAGDDDGTVGASVRTSVLAVGQTGTISAASGLRRVSVLDGGAMAGDGTTGAVLVPRVSTMDGSPRHGISPRVPSRLEGTSVNAPGMAGSYTRAGRSPSRLDK